MNSSEIKSADKKKKTWKTPEVHVEEIADSTKAGILPAGFESGPVYNIS